MTLAALPQVSGRHRNRELAGARRSRALELRAEGWTYDAIAGELGYANRGSVYSIIQKALADHEAIGAENFRKSELERLDQLEDALWDRAMKGEVSAVTQCRRIIEARVRLLGLLDKANNEASGDCRTVVCSCAPGTGHRASGRLE